MEATEPPNTTGVAYNYKVFCSYLTHVFTDERMTVQTTADELIGAVALCGGVLSVCEYSMSDSLGCARLYPRQLPAGKSRKLSWCESVL
jgi:hypothetical protein